MIVKSALNKIMSTVVLSVCMLGLVACSKSDTGVSIAAESKSESIVYSGENTVSPVNDLVLTEKEQSASISYAKPGADVRLADTSVITIDVAVLTNIELELVAAYQDGQMSVGLSSSEGLSLLGITEQLFVLGSGARYRLPVQLLAQEHGRYYIHIHIAVERDGRKDSRVLSAIVQVGTPTSPSKSLQKIPTVNSDNENLTGQRAQGEAVIILPARETIFP